MADELLAALVGVLGGAVLAAATLAGGYLLRRIHDHSARILALEMEVDRLRLFEEDTLLQGRRRSTRRRLRKGGGGHPQ